MHVNVTSEYIISIQIAASVKYRMMAMHHHFAHNMGLKKMKPAFDKNIQIDQSIKWEIRKRWSWRFSNSVSPKNQHTQNITSAYMVNVY